MRISFFPSLGITTPEHADLPWDELRDRLTQSRPATCDPCLGSKCAQKMSGPGWSPAFYRDGVTRSKSNVTGVSLLVLDFDHHTAPELRRVVDHLAAYEFVLHSTHQHTDGVPRVRIILPLSEPVSRAQWTPFWLGMAAGIPRGVHPKAEADPSCKDASRFFFLPSHRPGVEPLVHHNAGRWLEPSGKSATPRVANPAPPEALVGALQDRIHPTSGRLLSSARVMPAETVDLGAIRDALKRSDEPVAKRILAGESLSGDPFGVDGNQDTALYEAADLLAFASPIVTPPAAAWEVIRPAATAMGWQQGLEHCQAEFEKKFLRKQEHRRKLLETEREAVEAIRAVASRETVEQPAEEPATEDDEPTTQLVYIRAWDKYVFRDDDGEWRLRTPLSRPAAINRLQGYLEARGKHDSAEALEELASLKKAAKRLPDHPLCEAVDAVDCTPGRGRIYSELGVRLLNTYTPPALVPEAGEWPTIALVINWLTSAEGEPDPEGARWLTHWIACKVQNPGGSLPTTAILNGSTASGKGTLYAAIEAILGRQNCVTINDIASEFNAHYASKLFTFADECVTTGGLKDISQRMKLAITAPEIVVNQKGIQQFTVKNRSAWLFASNSDRPLDIEAGDRRYSVFTNYSQPPEGYSDALFGLWEPRKQNVPTAGFLREIQAFAAHLLTIEVDWPLVRVPHQSRAREQLIESSADSALAFVAMVRVNGWGAIVHEVDAGVECPPAFRTGPQGGAHARYVYAVYAAWCKANGHRHPLPSQHFGRKLIRAGWPRKKLPGVVYWPPGTEASDGVGPH